MSELEFSFGAEPWEEYIESCGSAACAMTLLTLLEAQDEDVFDDAMDLLQQKKASLDLSRLPAPILTGESAVRLHLEEQLVKKGLKASDLDVNDPLRLFLEELAMTPAAGDARILAAEAAAGDEGAQLSLTNLFMSRVIDFACEHVGHGVLLMDLIQEGSLALWQTIADCTPETFEADCEYAVRFAMAKTVTEQARENGVGQKMRTALEDYRSVDEQLLADLGRNPTVEEIAEGLHVTADTAELLGKMVENARRLRQATPEPEPDEEDPDELQSVENTAYYQSRQRVNDMLADLSEQESKLISLRFGLDGGLPMSPQQVGQKLGMTADQVVAMEAAALEKMRRQ